MLPQKICRRLQSDGTRKVPSYWMAQLTISFPRMYGPRRPVVQTLHTHFTAITWLSQPDDHLLRLFMEWLASAALADAARPGLAD